MDLGFSNIDDKLVKAHEIQIPDIFFKRLKTGDESVDFLFGDGLLPGSTFTLAANPGTGKSTFALQVANMLGARKYAVGYTSGEESKEMVAFTCKRLSVTNVDIGNITDLHKILSLCEDLDLLIIDSFPTLKVDSGTAKSMGKEELEKYKINKIVQTAQKTECVIGIILHVTKSGQYKGSTDIPHAVDMNVHIRRDPDQSDLRIISTEKNRFGAIMDMSVYFTTQGFDFKTGQQIDDLEARQNAQSKKGRSLAERDAIMLALDVATQNNLCLTLQGVCSIVKIQANRASYLLSQLVSEGYLAKRGRGANADWVKGTKQYTPALAPGVK